MRSRKTPPIAYFLSLLCAAVVGAFAYVNMPITVEQNLHGVVFIENEYVIPTLGRENKEGAPPKKNKKGKTEKNSGLGAGFFWDENGTIVTAAHVVIAPPKAVQTLIVRFPNSMRQWRAEVVKGDLATDIAVLKIVDWAEFKRTEAWTPLTIGSTRNLPAGERAYAIGHPFGLPWSVTRGTVTGLHRRFDPTPNFYVQTDAGVYPGNSGGPLFDSRGRVIGINDIEFGGAEESKGSFGMAISIEVIQKVVRGLLEGKVEWAQVGVVFDPTKDVLTIKETMPKTAASNADIRGGDRLLYLTTPHVFKMPMLTPTSLIDEIVLCDPGDEVTLILQRDGKLLEKRITLGEKKVFPNPMLMQRLLE